MRTKEPVYSYDPIEEDIYRRGFFAAKRKMMRQIRRRFSHLRPIDQLDLKKLFRNIKPESNCSKIKLDKILKIC